MARFTDLGEHIARLRAQFIDLLARFIICATYFHYFLSPEMRGTLWYISFSAVFSLLSDMSSRFWLLLESLLHFMSLVLSCTEYPECELRDNSRTRAKCSGDTFPEKTIVDDAFTRIKKQPSSYIPI